MIPSMCICGVKATISFWDLHIEFHHISFNNDDCLNSQWASADHGSDQWCPVSWQAGHCLTHKWRLYARQGYYTYVWLCGSLPTFCFPTVVRYLATAHQDGTVAVSVGVAEQFSWWVTRIIHKMHAFKHEPFHISTTRSASTLLELRGHLCGGALCRVGRGNRGQPVGLWSCRWSCDYLACTLVKGNRFFSDWWDDVLKGLLIWFM